MFCGLSCLNGSFAGFCLSQTFNSQLLSVVKTLFSSNMRCCVGLGTGLTLADQVKVFHSRRPGTGLLLTLCLLDRTLCVGKEGDILMALCAQHHNLFLTPGPLKTEHSFVMLQVYTSKCRQFLAKELCSDCSHQGPHRHLTFLETWHLLNHPLSISNLLLTTLTPRELWQSCSAGLRCCWGLPETAQILLKLEGPGKNATHTHILQVW